MLATALASLLLAAPPDGAAVIRISDGSTGCFHQDERRYEWRRDGSGWIRDGSRLPAAEVESIRDVLLHSRGAPVDLLARVGFTPEAFAAHRDAIVALVAPPTWRDASGKPLPLPPELEPLLSFERLAGPVRSELVGEGFGSTTQVWLVVELPGDPRIVARTHSQQPGMLPWKVTAGGKTWTTVEPAISAALLRLVDPTGPSARRLDGTPYWTEDIWQDASLWSRLVGDELVQQLALRQAATAPGYAEFDRRFVVEKAESGGINGQPDSAFYRVSARRPQLVDAAWWWNPLENGARTRTWNDFLRAFDEVAEAASRQQWLADWKAAGSDRHVEAHIVGVTPVAETMLAMLVQPGWAHAGFRGTPEIELLLRRGDQWCGTIYLARNDRRAFIETAKHGPGQHWFDQLELSFHPNGDPPAYGLVEGGRVTVREMPRRKP